MIGRFIFAGGEGKEFQINDVDGLNIAIISDYRWSIGYKIFKELLDSDYSFILHDYLGIYNYIRNSTRLYAGIDIKIPVFNNTDSLSIFYLQGVLDYILKKNGYRMDMWKTVFIHSVNDILNRRDNELRSILEELQVFKNESTGVDKQAYTVLLDIFNNIFTYNDIELLSGDYDDTVIDRLDGKIIIDYTRINNIIGRLLIMAIYYYNILIKRDDFKIILPYGDFLIHSLYPRNIFLKSFFWKNQIIFLDRYYKELTEYFNIIIIDNQLLPQYMNNISLIPSEALESNYLYIDKYSMSFIKVKDIINEFTREKIEYKPIEDNYLDIYRDIIVKILNIVLENGRLSIDGILVNLGYPDKAFIYSIVDRLWRDGYLRRVSDRSGEYYRISVRGMKFLKEYGDESGEA